MSVTRKVLAVALQCALLALVVVGSSGACERMGVGAMPPMDHSMPDSHQHHAPAPEQQPAAPDNCVQMATCSLTAVTVSALVVEVPATAVAAAPVARVEELRSVIRTPEPPPPRARLS